MTAARLLVSESHSDSETNGGSGGQTGPLDVGSSVVQWTWSTFRQDAGAHHEIAWQRELGARPLVYRSEEKGVAKIAKCEGLSPAWSAALAVGAVTAALLVGKRAGPTPDHPKTRRWYRRLEKPDYTPPSPIYPIAWTGIQASLAYAGYRLLRSAPSDQRNTALALWTANQVGIGGWSEVFFGQRSPGRGTVASAALGATAAGYVAAASHTDKIAGRLGVPLVAWVAFATLLSEEIWRKNDARSDDGAALS